MDMFHVTIPRQWRARVYSAGGVGFDRWIDGPGWVVADDAEDLPKSLEAAAESARAVMFAVPCERARFLVRDESGHGGTVTLDQGEVAERFGDDWEDAMDGEAVFVDVLGAMDMGEELRLDGATVVVRVG